MLELIFEMKSETRKIMCYQCFTVVQGKIFFMEVKGALAHFIAPTIDKHFICDECKKKKTLKPEKDEPKTKQSEFMKEWEGFLSKRKDIQLSILDYACHEIKTLAKLIDKHKMDKQKEDK